MRAMGRGRKPNEPIVKEKVEKPENAVYDYYESETVNGEFGGANASGVNLSPTPKNDYTRPVQQPSPYQQPHLPAEPGMVLFNNAVED